MRIPFMILGLAEDRPEVESAIRRVIDRGWFVGRFQALGAGVPVRR